MQRYDARTALVVVDLQNDFADPDGSLAVHGGANLVPIINAEIAMARSEAATVAFTQDWHPETTPTELEKLLREAAVEWVVVCGLATDYCVKATALDARRLGFETAVLLDAIRPVELAPGDGERAIGEMTEAGVHSWSTRMR